MHHQDEILENHLAKLCMSSALDGGTMGTPLRWAREAVTELGDAGHKGQVNIQQSHIDMIDLACRLADKKPKSPMKDTDWQQGLHDLSIFLKECGRQQSIPLSFQ